MGRAATRRLLLCLPLVGALGVAACQPVVAQPPSPPPPPPWCADASGQPSTTARVAVVDEGGSRPEVVKFQARNEQEQDDEVATLRTRGDVLAVGPDTVLRAA